MGAIGSKLTKPLRNFAIESRAEKILSQDKPKPATWHPSTEKQIKDYINSNPDLLEEQLKKDDLLHQRLRDVYVTSQDAKQSTETPMRRLPQDRKTVIEPELGLPESEMVPKGKMSLRQALTFLANHQQDPQKYTAALLAEERFIEERTAENVLKYFRTFELVVPPTSKEESKTTAGKLSSGVAKLLTVGKKDS